MIYHSHYSNANEIAQAIKFCYDSFTTNKEINLSSFTDCRTKTFRFANFLKKDFMSLEKLLIEKGINVKNTRFKTNKNKAK